MSGWRPIETYPGDGDAVLALMPNVKYPIVAFLKRPWYQPYLIEAHKHVGSQWHAVRFCVNGRVDQIEDSALPCNPTHWQPMPPIHDLETT